MFRIALVALVILLGGCATMFPATQSVSTVAPQASASHSIDRVRGGKSISIIIRRVVPPIISVSPYGIREVSP